MMVGSGDLWVPRFVVGVGVHFDFIGTTRKVAMYEDCS
jgi:hypothetical protein